MSACSSMATLSRRLSRSLHSNSHNIHSMRFCTTTTTTTTSNLSSSSSSSSSSGSDSDESNPLNLDSDSAPDYVPPPPQPSPDGSSNQKRFISDRQLENGLDVGVYKAILVGQVGQTPMQKKLKSGTMLTMFSVGTGGIRNNRRPFNNENPTEYANRCDIQWHRVCVYPEKLGMIAMKNAVPGSILYLEGNLETKIFTDPTTGLVRRVREIAVRRNSRLVFLGNGEGPEGGEPPKGGLKGVGYY